MRIEVRHLVQQVDHMLAGCVFGKARLHLPHVGIARAEIGEEDDHVGFLHLRECRLCRQDREAARATANPPGVSATRT
jgi:hypothetical protein